MAAIEQGQNTQGRRSTKLDDQLVVTVTAGTAGGAMAGAMVGQVTGAVVGGLIGAFAAVVSNRSKADRS